MSALSTAPTIDHRARTAAQAQVLGDIALRLPDPDVNVVCTTHSYGAGTISVHVIASGTTMRDAAAVADALGLDEHTWHDCACDRHHAWDGAFEGFPVKVVWIEKGSHHTPA